VGVKPLSIPIVDFEQIEKEVKMNFHFTMATESWIIGKALAILLPDAKYVENRAVDGQEVIVSHARINKDSLNEAISKVKICCSTSSKSVKTEYLGIPATVITIEEEFAGDRFKMNDISWTQFKDWVREHGEVMFESKNTIEIKDKVTTK
jgi:hypothetical protein